MNKNKSWFKKITKQWNQWFNEAPININVLYAFLKQCKEQEIINKDTCNMLECVIELAPKQVRDILIPKSHIVSLSLELTLPQIIQIISESGHSRFPVFDKNKEEVLGILHAKDLLSFENKNHKDDDFDLYDVLRQAIFVPESKSLLTLLSEFRNTRTHMAIVVDEYGEISGLVTLEDITEQIVGEIEDEFDVSDERLIKTLGKNRYTIKGHTPIEAFNKIFNSILLDNEYDTIAGMITASCGHVPKRGEIININGFQFKILHTNERRIQLLECCDKRNLGSES